MGTAVKAVFTRNSRRVVPPSRPLMSSSFTRFPFGSADRHGRPWLLSREINEACASAQQRDFRSVRGRNRGYATASYLSR
jgi:hypothetical protein